MSARTTNAVLREVRTLFSAGTLGGLPEGDLLARFVARRDEAAFDEILGLAVHSSFTPEVYGTDEAWQRAVAGSDVRLQWDPDHDPSGSPLERRAIQLGLRGEVLARYAKEWLLGIEDVSELVAKQRTNARAPYERLVTPSEDVYPIPEPKVAPRQGVT